jgi:hypothetical protein
MNILENIQDNAIMNNKLPTSLQLGFTLNRQYLNGGIPGVDRKKNTYHRNSHDSHRRSGNAVPFSYYFS